MEDYTLQNKRAWEYDAYDFWCRMNGTPQQRAQQDMQNPKAMLRK